MSQRRLRPDQTEDFRGSFVKQHDGTRTKFTPPGDLAARAEREMRRWRESLSPAKRKRLDEIQPLRAQFFDQYKGRPKPRKP